MSDLHLLFVYGLLRCDQIGYKSLKLDTRARHLGRERIHGRLYHLGDYPGAITSERGIVHGDLLAFEDPALWQEIDDYELFDPDRPTSSEYRRVEVDLLDSGKRAWTYEYNKPVTGRPVIASGNWWSR